MPDPDSGRQDPAPGARERRAGRARLTLGDIERMVAAGGPAVDRGPRPQRILPVASGKGGVGKTTFAVNFALALSRVAPTILVDLDTGTSSVRNTIGVAVDKDLYHFHRRGAELTECITRLDRAYDPHGHFEDFGFVAGPRHFIDELANPDADLRQRLGTAINRLPATYVVLDLKAGLDSRVLDFLPYTNSGILVFTPHHPAATLAASDIVKAILFRSLRILFADGSPFYGQPGMARYRTMISDLLNRVEDVYDESIPHLDAFLGQLEEAFGDHPILHVIADTLTDFRVNYVLNMFNGVEESHEGAIAPFVRNLADNVSSRLQLTQLGWILQDPEVHRSNCSGHPILLPREKRPVRRPPVDPVLAELAAIESAALGIRRPVRRAAPSAAATPPGPAQLGAQDALAGQLAALEAMYSDRTSDSVQDNFAYITYRALNLMAPHMGAGELGQPRLRTPHEVRSWFLKRQR